MGDSLVLRIRMAHYIGRREVIFFWRDAEKSSAMAELEGELRRIVAEEVAAALVLRQAAREEEARDE